MKIFKDGEFACPQHIIESGIDKNGRQTISVCIKCRLDDRDICCGDIIVCINYHKENNYDIAFFTGNAYIKSLKKRKEETLTLPEVVKFVEEYTSE